VRKHKLFSFAATLLFDASLMPRAGLHAAYRQAFCNPAHAAATRGMSGFLIGIVPLPETFAPIRFLVLECGEHGVPMDGDDCLWNRKISARALAANLN
jgi:hypothetical protein